MSKGNTTENDLVAYVFNNTAIPWAAETTLYIALHTADPGEAGTQTTSEAAYTGYARVAVSRNSSGWTVAGNQASNTAQVQFPTCTDNLGGTPTATHFSVGRLASGGGQIFYKGALNSALAISQNVTPQFAAGALVVTED